MYWCYSLFKQKCLHICTIKDEAGESALMSGQTQWEGRLKAVKKEIKQEPEDDPVAIARRTAILARFCELTTEAID